MVIRITIFLSVLITYAVSQDIHSQTVVKNFHKSFLEEGDTTYQVNLTRSGKPDRYFAPDKAKHFLAGMIATIFIYQSFENQLTPKENRYLAGGVTVSLGVLKEIYDKSKPENHFSWKDLVADVLGMGMGFVLVNQP